MEQSNFTIDHEHVKLVIVSSEYDSKEDANIELAALMEATIECLEKHLKKLRGNGKNRKSAGENN